MNNVLDSYPSFPKVFAVNYIWLCHNLCKKDEATKQYPLEEKNLVGVMRIFYEFIDHFSKFKDESSFLEIVKSLSNLSATSNPQYLDQVSGIKFKQESLII